MTKELKIGLAIAALSLGLVLFRSNFRPSSNVKNETTETVAEQSQPADQKADAEPHEHVAVEQVRPRVPPQKPEIISAAEKSFTFKVNEKLSQEQKEVEALNRYARALYIFSSNDQRPEALVKKLTEAGLKPLVVQDFNEVTGKMVVIRTDETLPGTRYFHAQYFEDENKQPFLQHMSFEFRPSEKSFDESVAAIQKQFPSQQLGQAHRCTDDFTAWEWGQMTVWCHKMSKEDIENTDPTRAHGPEDVGTIRCAAEQNPHPQDDLCGG